MQKMYYLSERSGRIFLTLLNLRRVKMPKNTKKYDPKNIVLTVKDNVSLGQVGGNFNTRLKINYNDIENTYYEVESDILPPLKASPLKRGLLVQ